MRLLRAEGEQDRARFSTRERGVGHLTFSQARDMTFSRPIGAEQEAHREECGRCQTLIARIARTIEHPTQDVLVQWKRGLLERPRARDIEAHIEKDRCALCIRLMETQEILGATEERLRPLTGALEDIRDRLEAAGARVRDYFRVPLPLPSPVRSGVSMTAQSARLQPDDLPAGVREILGHNTRGVLLRDKAGVKLLLTDTEIDDDALARLRLGLVRDGEPQLKALRRTESHLEASFTWSGERLPTDMVVVLLEE